MTLHATDPRTVPFHRFCHDTCRVEFEHFPISCDHTRPWIDVPRRICCNCDEPISPEVT